MGRLLLSRPSPALLSAGWMWIGNKGFFADAEIYIGASSDALTFAHAAQYETTATPFGIPDGFVNNGIVYITGAFGVDTTGWTDQRFRVAKITAANTALVNHAAIDCSSYFGGGGHPQVWPTRHVVNADGTTYVDVDGCVYIVLEFCPNTFASPLTFHLHLAKLNAAVDTLVSIVPITGSGFLSNSSSQLDGQIIVRGPSTFDLIFKNDDTGKKCIEIARASSIAGDYAMLKTGDWANYSSGLTVPMEAPQLIVMPDRLRMLADQEGHSMRYSDCFNDDGSYGGTWSAMVAYTVPPTASPNFWYDHPQHGCIFHPPAGW